MQVQRPTDKSVAAFTLLELMTVIVIIAIIASMGLTIAADVRNRAETAACITNLKSLYTAGAAYVQENGMWPQVGTVSLKSPGDTTFANTWIAKFQPYGMAQKNWICPSIQRELKNPDLTQSSNVRLDYTPTPFDSNPGTPFRWPHQPWFIERGAVHPGGNLMIWSNGQLVSLSEALTYH